MIAKPAHGVGSLEAGAANHAALASGHGFHRMQTENIKIGQRAHRPALVSAAERMAGIGDQRQAMALRQCAQSIVVARLAGVIDGDDGSRVRSYLRFDSAGIDQ